MRAEWLVARAGSGGHVVSAWAGTQHSAGVPGAMRRTLECQVFAKADTFDFEAKAGSRCSSVAGMQLPMGVSQARAGAALLRLWSSTDAISTGHHKKRHPPPHTQFDLGGISSAFLAARAVYPLRL